MDTTLWCYVGTGAQCQQRVSGSILLVVIVVVVVIVLEVVPAVVAMAAVEIEADGEQAE